MLKSVKLSSRQKQILDLAREGLTSQEIADRLGIARRTEEKHRECIRKKLGLPVGKYLRQELNGE